MAFSEKIKANGSLQCSVCRKILKDGRRIRCRDYMGDAPICQACLERFYRDPASGLDIGIADDPMRLRVRFGLAEPLEHDPIFRRKEPPFGYEFPFPETLIPDTIRTTILWTILALSLRGLLTLLGIGLHPDISTLILRGVTAAGSAALAFLNTSRLIRGIFYGIGHTRRLVLIAETAVLCAFAAANIFI